MFWDKLFKKKEKSTDVASNYSINNFDYDKLSDNEKGYVNELINEYITFFDTNSETSKIDIDIISEIIIYQDLSLAIMYNEHFGNIIGSIIDSKKLAYYSHKIDELNNILKYKYIALNVIRKDKKYLTKHMGLYVLGKNKINIIRALDNQINIINNLLTVTNKNIYDYNAFVIANFPNIDNVDVKKELMELYEQVKEDYQKLFNVESYFEKELSIIDKIVYLELFIDKFIYENKDLIGKLKEKLEIISNSEIKDKEEQQWIIDNLMKIKMYYIIFHRYGRNKISKEEFYELYQIIFNVYTYYPCDCNFSSYYNSLTNSEEKEYYQKIIEYKIDLLKMKKSLIFNSDRKYSNNVYKTVLDIMDIEQKSFDQFPDPRYTRSSIIRRTISNNLPLLLSLDYENGFDMYFDSVNPINMKAYYKNISIPYNSNYIKREYYKYIIGFLKDNPSYKGDELDLFYYLYHSKINLELLPSLVSNYNLIDYQEYVNNSEVDNIYLPSITEEVTIDLYEIRDKRIYINNQLKELIIRINKMSDLMLFIKSSNLIFLPNSNLNISIVVNESIEKRKDVLLYTIDSLLSNIFSSFILPNSIQNMKSEEIIKYLTETYNGVYYFIKKMYIHSNDINYDEFYEMLKNIFTKMRYYSEYRYGCFPLNEMIDTTRNIKHGEKELKLSKEEIIYDAYIDVILYVSNIIDKENKKSHKKYLGKI